ncbi:MAG: NUDIX hydrolase [Proteobacteria bacterium]|nr:NUDIX hydrolase [Pseudomonadota bacterium]
MALKSETLHQGRVFTLVREEVDLPNGRRAVLDIVRHPGAAAMVPVDDKGRVLLLRQFRHAAGGFIWEIPAGTLEPGESPGECARRELAEETGQSAARWDKLTEILLAPGYSTEKIHIFLARDLAPDAQDLDADEVLTVHPVELSRAVAMISDGTIADAKTICGVLLAAALLGSPAG